MVVGESVGLERRQLTGIWASVKVLRFLQWKPFGRIHCSCRHLRYSAYFTCRIWWAVNNVRGKGKHFQRLFEYGKQKLSINCDTLN